jgi:hypothetical protein
VNTAPCPTHISHAAADCETRLQGAPTTHKLPDHASRLVHCGERSLQTLSLCWTSNRQLAKAGPDWAELLAEHTAVEKKLALKIPIAVCSTLSRQQASHGPAFSRPLSAQADLHCAHCRMQLLTVSTRTDAVTGMPADAYSSLLRADDPRDSAAHLCTLPAYTLPAFVLNGAYMHADLSRTLRFRHSWHSWSG